MTPSPGVTALDTALLGLSVHLKTPALAEIARLVKQGRDVLEQTEKHLEICTESSNAAHKALLTLRDWATKVRIELRRSSIGASIIAESLSNTLMDDPEQDAECPTFVLPTDTPRPTAAPL